MKEDSDPSYSEEIAHLSGWDRTFWLSRAFMEAGHCLCADMLKGDFSSQYSSSRVILHLVRQGIELFLKAAIEVAGEHTSGLGHDLDGLCSLYWALYKDQSFHFQIPPRFLVSASFDLFPELTGRLRATMDQRYRYAADRKGESFASLEVFDPIAAIREILELKRCFGIIEWAMIKPSLPKYEP